MPEITHNLRAWCKTIIMCYMHQALALHCTSLTKLVKHKTLIFEAVKLIKIYEDELLAYLWSCGFQCHWFVGYLSRPSDANIQKSKQ